ARAVVEAVLGHKSPFVRTPKYNGNRDSTVDPLLRRRIRPLPLGTTELILGLLMLACFVAAFTRPHTLVGAPFLLLFASG
ncbi:MAG: glycosyl transferase family 2, partial [Pseudomonas stutzeri]|nr:glycosyl transferase family 2 [Stutzerimonas stutzeri]NIO14027.1 glycosyl transferase family 2 [Xanthomonadales bacterium]NIP02718.1 glycosyl transferase family 2 [Stutzerimonas stutzeri]NIQ24437.1 glycosyl transferase family 2 [Stutzerimonas stutzeri]NIQ35453.1 glycosyl transferase family 2 [Xanthomonadales bacterium]